MKSLHQEFSVPFRYQVLFTRRLFGRENPLLRQELGRLAGGRPARVLAVIDAGVAGCHPGLAEDIGAYFEGDDHLRLVTPPLTVPGGEAAKNDPQLVERLLEAINEYGIDRHAYVIGIGGGAALDLVGYAAAIAHRGIRHIRVPTTVLAQNDAGIGVKNGVNYFGKKNFLGTFAPPVAVINDLDFLQTLDDRDWRAGISEAVKVSLIKDGSFFDWLEEQAPALARREEEPMAYLIYECARLHLKHIAGGDPFEMGSSRPLDFGHWAAHKLEQLTRYQLRHGEAVAIGIALDTVYSTLSGRLDAASGNRVIELLRRLGFELYVPELHQTQDGRLALVAGLEEFREHLGGQLTIMLLENIGQGREVHDMDPAVIHRSIDQLKLFHQTVTWI